MVCLSSCANLGGRAETTLKLAFCLAGSAGKRNPHWFSSWDAFWMPPSWQSSIRWVWSWWGRTVVPSASPILPPSLKSDEPGRAAVCSELWLMTWVTCAGKQKSMLPLCAEVQGGSTTTLWNTAVRLPRSVKQSHLTEGNEMQGGADQILLARVSNTHCLGHYNPLLGMRAQR